MGPERRRGHQLAAGVVLVGAAVGAGLLGDPTSAGVVGALATLTLLAGGVLIEQWYAERRDSRRSGVVFDRGRLEPWRSTLWAAVQKRRLWGADSQLQQMLDDGGVIPLSTGDEGGSFVEATAGWARSPARLVVLGEAGYGKTVAALTLLAHVNGSEDVAGRPVAELFPLGEWYAWAADHPDRPLGEWLATELTTSYPPLDGATAEALLDHHLVLPILDGLDEVPERHRRACTEAIDAHAGVTEPFRPFVVTCRSTDYESLGPDPVRADRTVRLVGLTASGVADVIEARAARHPGWETTRDLLGAADSSVADLLRSPLRLSLALQVYEDGGAEELAGLETRAADERLWEGFLAHGSSGFDGAAPDRVRAWLTFLARGLRAEGRGRFSLHELYLFAPVSTRTLHWFRRATAAAVVATAGAGIAAAALAAGGSAVASLTVGSLVGGIAALGLGMATGEGDGLEQPSLVVGTARLRTRVWSARREVFAAMVLAGGLTYLVKSLYGILAGVVLGTVVLLAAVTDPTFLQQRSLHDTDPAGPVAMVAHDTVLTRTLRGALVWGGAWGGFVVLMLSGIAGTATAIFLLVQSGTEHALETGLAVGLWTLVGLAPAGILVGVLARGGFAWLYHWCLRWRLAASGLLPWQLLRFLDWCAAPERRWLRRTDGYEFGHRTLLAHLAPEPDDVDHGGTGAGDDDERGPSDGVTPGSDDPPWRRWSWSRRVLVGLVGGVVLLGALRILLAVAFREMGVDYVGDDEPRHESARGGDVPAQGVVNAYAFWDEWDLGPGDDIRSTFHADARFDRGDIGSLTGDLTLYALCDDARVSWQLTADGRHLAGGTLEPDQPDSMGDVRPDDADAGTRFVLTARRTDSADCAATLEWWLPGFNTPGIGSWTEF